VYGCSPFVSKKRSAKTTLHSFAKSGRANPATQHEAQKIIKILNYPAMETATSQPNIAFNIRRAKIFVLGGVSISK